jgi:hypothetical protein
VVVAANDSRQGSLAEPLGFLEPTTCTVTQPSTGAAQGSAVKVSARLDPATGDGPLELPSQVDVSREVTQYTVAVTDEFGQPPSLSPDNSLLGELKALPTVLVGIGVIGLGAVLFLGVLLRRRVL